MQGEAARRAFAGGFYCSTQEEYDKGDVQVSAGTKWHNFVRSLREKKKSCADGDTPLTF